jgi:hypothetical protein
MSTWGSIVIMAIALIAATALLLGIWWVWWRLPQIYVAGLAPKIRAPKALAEVEDNFRKTVGQALGGAAVLIGACAAYLQFSQQQQTATQQIIAQQKIASDQLAAQQQASEISRKASEDLLISNQVSKGFEQLASDKVPMRLGGIYGLEGLMNTSQQYRVPVLEALCAFVRDGTVGSVNDKPATDIQAALTVIGRRTQPTQDVDLRGANLAGANLSRADLTGANLAGANLTGANLTEAKLGEANLSRANLTGTRLLRVDLHEAGLSGAHLNDAFLVDANLNGADLIDANLSGADLSDARLIDAILVGADLNDANLNRADLRITVLDGQEQLDKACGEDAKLPPGLTLKPCPEKPVAPPLNRRGTTP